MDYQIKTDLNVYSLSSSIITRFRFFEMFNRGGEEELLNTWMLIVQLEPNDAPWRIDCGETGSQASIICCWKSGGMKLLSWHVDLFVDTLLEVEAEMHCCFEAAIKELLLLLLLDGRRAILWLLLELTLLASMFRHFQLFWSRSRVIRFQTIRIFMSWQLRNMNWVYCII